jgi:hypothetical protein
MDFIENTRLTMWLARIFIIFFIIGLVYWIYRKKERYNYKGIKEYKNVSIFDSFINHFSTIFKKDKKKPRQNKTENKCRKILENIYKRPFPTKRPDFLKSPMTKMNLELDCYNEELKLALEYNGPQHYKYIPHFHKNKRAFYAQVHRDDWKRKKCRELGITLIEIPYWVIDVDLRDYIIKELRKKGVLS